MSFQVLTSDPIVAETSKATPGGEVVMTAFDALGTVRPKHPDGTAYGYNLVGENYLIGADTQSEIVDVILDGHRDADEEGRFALREQFMLTVRTSLQLADALKVTEETGWTPDSLPEEDYDALMEEYRPISGEWNHPIPIFLIATDYAPYTDTPPATGNVKWLNPANESSFIQSLIMHNLNTFYVDDNAVRIQEAAAAAI